MAAGAWAYPVNDDGLLAGVDPLIIVAGYVVAAGLAVIIAVLWWR